MNICVYGAGAIGGYLGFLLQESDNTVTLVDKGAHCEAIKRDGLTLRMGGASRTLLLDCTDDPSSLPVQDIVIIAVKTYSIPGILPHIPPLLGPESSVVNVNNGIPWWYFHRDPAAPTNPQLDSVDPGGEQWSMIDPARAIGCVVYPACKIAAPAVIEHVSGNRFALGEPSGEKTERLQTLANLLRDCGLKAAIKTRIRDEVWIKLWGNMAFNPISVLTGATLAQICHNPATRQLVKDMMVEARQVGEALGIKFSIDEDKRIEGAADVGDHKTSMLQDYEAGLPLETAALLGAVQELGHKTDIATPVIDYIAALLALKCDAKAGH